MIRLLRSSDNHVLWSRCVSAWLDANEGSGGRGGWPAYLWLRNRAQRDLLLEAADARGVRGWLNPPFCYLGDLPERFHLEGRTVGLLTRRRLISRISARHAALNGIQGMGGDSGVVRGHMLDGLLGEILPEGVAPDRLRDALGRVAPDGFAEGRNAWIADTLADYLAALRERGLYDFRETNALLADAVEDGRLPRAVDGAGQLHVYGLYTLRTRRRLLETLARQDDVVVHVYAPAETEPGEWDAFAQELGLDVETLPAGGARRRVVQPAPNPHRELGWMAARVKAIVAGGEAAPHEIAVVARTGREDIRRAHGALVEAGVPATARIRTPLAEIPVLKALLELFRGGAEGWGYRTLRHVFASPYFDFRVDLRWVDFLAGLRRPDTLAGWERELASLLERVRAGEESGEMEPELWPLRVRAERLEQDLGALTTLRARVEPLAAARSESAWVEAALELVRDGAFGLRALVCRTPDDRYDIVRLDQRGLHQMEELLYEWSQLDLDAASLAPADWYVLLQRLLQSHELQLATPLQKGVQLVEAHDAALTPYRLVFVLHANDGVFPARGGAGGVLSDAERQRLRDAGVRMEDHESELRQERCLWRAVVANPWVEASYRTTNASGTPLLPSLMVDELLPPDAHESELPRSFDPIGQPLAPAQARQAATLELAEAMRRLGDGAHPPRTRVDDPHALRHAILNALAEQERGGRGTKFADAPPPPNPWNGRIGDPVALERIAEAFGAEHVWSASQLELYSRAPFLFLLDRVLRLRELTEAEEDTTALTAGSISHEILQKFYAPYLEGGLPASLDDAAAKHLGDVADRVIAARLERREWLGSPVLWRVRRELIERQLHDYLAWELGEQFEPGAAPLECELEIEGADGFVTVRGVDCEGGDVELRLRGRIDRVDAAGELRRVVDYKSSSIPEKIDFRRGVSLQTPLYMAALHQSRGVEVERGEYRSLKGSPTGKKPRVVAWGDAEFTEALAIAFSIPARVRLGLFETALPAKQKWKDWDPGPEIRRGNPEHPALEDREHRFHD